MNREKKAKLKTATLVTAAALLVMAPAAVVGYGAVKTVKSYFGADRIYWLIHDVENEATQENIDALYDFITGTLKMDLKPTLAENIDLAENILEQFKMEERDGKKTFIVGNAIGAGSIATVAGGAIVNKAIQNRPAKPRKREEDTVSL